MISIRRTTVSAVLFAVVAMLALPSAAESEKKADRKPELRALHRYQVACALVWRWNGQLPNSAETAEWIMEVGEGKRPTDIEQFRERLLK